MSLKRHPRQRRQRPTAPGGTLAKTLFVAAIHQVKVIADLDRGMDLGGGLLITNNRSVIESVLAERQRQLAIELGVLGYTEITAANLLVYAHPEWAGEKALNQKTLLDASARLEIFLQFFLWLEQDNAASMTPVYLAGDEVQRFDPYVVCSQADGTSKACTIRRAAFEAATRNTLAWRGERSQAEKVPVGIVDPRYSAMTRAMHFASGIRQVRHLSSKVAGCFTALEALLCDSSNDVKEQLATRIAVLIGHGSRDQRRIYNLIRRLYKVRCDYVHGSASNRSGKSIRKASIEISQILRDVIRQEMGVSENRGKHLTKLSDRWTSAHGQPQPTMRKKPPRKKRPR